MTQIEARGVLEVSIRSPAPGEIHLFAFANLDQRQPVVSIRSPAPGEIHAAEQQGDRRRRALFQSAPQRPGRSTLLRREDQQMPKLFQSAPQRPGRST